MSDSNEVILKEIKSNFTKLELSQNTKIDALLLENQKLQQNVNKLQQDNQKVQQDNVIINHKLDTLQTTLQFIQESMFKDKNITIEKVVKGKAAATAATTVSKTAATMATADADAKVADAKADTKASAEIVIKKGLPFFKHCLVNEEEFQLRSKFSTILDSEKELATTAKLSVEDYRNKKDYITKLSNHVWKNDKTIQADITKEYTEWCKKIVEQVPQFEEDNTV